MAKLMRILQDRMRMLREDAVAVAEVVESAFRGSEEVDDELLGKDLRQVFYDLQDENILEVRRDVHDVKGREERHYYWRIADKELRGEDAPPRVPDADELVYRRLREDAWERRRPLDPSLS